MSKANRIPLHKRAHLSRAVAAEYIGVTAKIFDRMVASGQMPPPAAIGNRRVWNRAGIESAVWELPDAPVEARAANGGEWLH